MPYLHLAVSTVFATLFALGYKVAAKRGCDLCAVNMWLYIGATFALLVNLFITGPKFNGGAVTLGILNGISLFTATLAFLYHMRSGKLAVSWTVISLSLAFPVAASVLIWHEHPSLKQWIGLGLIPIAFLLMGERKKVAD